MLDFDKLLAEASLPEEVVLVCLNGRLVRQYEEVKARVDAAAAAATLPSGDDRLGVKKAKAHPEQADLDRLAAEIQQKTAPFLLRAMPRDKYIELVASHPARKDKAGAVDPRDRELGVNTDTFLPALVRGSLADPDVSDDARWERLQSVLTFRQIDVLALAGWNLNREDREVPFSPSGSPSPLSSDPG